MLAASFRIRFQSISPDRVCRLIAQEDVFGHGQRRHAGELLVDHADAPRLCFAGEENFTVSPRNMISPSSGE